jgi:predicted nucleotidyltransferase component of viral defense system
MCKYTRGFRFQRLEILRKKTVTTKCTKNVCQFFETNYGKVTMLEVVKIENLFREKVRVSSDEIILVKKLWV